VDPSALSFRQVPAGRRAPDEFLKPIGELVIALCENAGRNALRDPLA